MKTVFALSSWGNAGVPWILDCLNLHPQLHAWSCRHYGAHAPLGGDLSMPEYFDAMARLGWADHEAVGDVHGVGWDQFAELSQVFGESFRGGHLVGHPVPRLAGSFAFSQAMGRDWKHGDFLSLWGMQRDDPRAQAALAVLGEDGDHVPAHYMINVNSISAICGPGGPLREPVFKLEDLMRSDAEWDRMIRHFSAGAVDYGAAWRALEGRTIGVAHEPFASSPKAVWDSLPDYVRRTVAAMLTEPSRAAFENLGYDLSFIR